MGDTEQGTGQIRRARQQNRSWELMGMMGVGGKEAAVVDKGRTVRPELWQGQRLEGQQGERR